MRLELITYFLEENCEKQPGKVRSALSKGAHATYNGLNSKAGRIASGAVGGLGAAGAAGAAASPAGCPPLARFHPSAKRRAFHRVYRRPLHPRK